MTRRTTRRAAGNPTVRIGGTLAIPAILSHLGHDPAEVLSEVGLDLGLFDDPDNRISYAARGKLIEHCVARTGCEHFGLLVGQQGGLHSLGLVGLLVRHSPDVRTALQSLVNFLHLHVRGAVPGLAASDGTAIFSYDIYQRRVAATDQIGDGAVATMLNIMRELCGRAWKPLEVRFAHRRPSNIRPFRRFFGVPLHFDAEQNALVFAARWLDQPLPETEPELLQLLQAQVDALEARYADDFPDQVRSVLRTALVTGHFSADNVAALFSIHSRTLNRRLHAFGSSYRELVEEGRYEIAQQMLRDTQIEISQIAGLLSYADASAFTRAFRRWSGTTPAAWRVRHAHDG